MDGVSKHWLFGEELKWRIVAANVWTGILSFGLGLGFLLVWIMHPKSCFYFFPEYLQVLATARAWLVIFLISVISIVNAQLDLGNCKVQLKLKTSMFKSLTHLFCLKNAFSAFVSGVFGAVFVGLNFVIVNNEYSQLTVFCTDGIADARCLNEVFFVAVVFGFLFAFTQSLKFDGHIGLLQFDCVQPSHLLMVKYRFLENVKVSVLSTYKFLQFFIPGYYLVAKHAFLFVSETVGLFDVELPYDCAISPLKPFKTLVLFWSLLLSGTFLLTLRRLSWQLTNLFLVKNYPFLMETFFGDKTKMLLVNNLDSSQPLLIQHIAFQSLSDAVCASSLCRKYLFDVPADSSVKHDNVGFNRVADECLARIKSFSDDLRTCYYQVTNGTLFKTTKTKEKVEEVVTGEGLRSHLVSNLKRRALRLNTDTTSDPNKTLGSSLLKDGDNNKTDTDVTSPRLWTVKSPIRKLHENPDLNEKNFIDQTWKQGQKDKKAEPKVSVMRRFSAWIKSHFTYLDFFFAQQADRHFANLFTNFHIVRWSVRSLSVLAAKSVDEDDYGVVQCRLRNILQQLLDLLTGLERNCKIPTGNSSQAVLLLVKRQQALKAECVSALYRISNAFPRHLDSIHLEPEQSRRLALFTEYKC